MPFVITGEELEGGGQLPLLGLGVHPHEIALRLEVQPRVDHQRLRPRMPAMPTTSVLNATPLSRSRHQC